MNYRRKGFEFFDEGYNKGLEGRPLPQGNIPKFGDKKFDLSDEEEHTVDDSMIVSEKKLPPLSPQKVTEKMIISESRSGIIEHTQQKEKKIKKEPKVIFDKSKTNDDVLMLNENDLIVDGAPKKASPPEFKHLVKEKKPSVATEKTIKISNTHAGIGGNLRLKIKETPTKVSQETPTEISDEDWFKHNENSSTEEEYKIQSQKQEVKAPSFWQRTKSKVGNVLKTIGLVGALAGGAKYANEHTEVSKVSASETQNSWNNSDSEDKFEMGIKGNLPKEAKPEDIDPRFYQVNELKRELYEKGIDVSKDLTASAKSKLKYDEELKLLYNEMLLLQNGLDTETGWANKAKQRKFNELLKNPEIRSILSAREDLTMADAFSLIKSEVNSEGTKNPQENFKDLLEKRDELAKTNFISPTTEQVIIFDYDDGSGNESDFKGKKLAETAKIALGSKAEKKPDNFIKTITTRNVDLDSATPGEELTKAIGDSPDNTTLYLSTHSDKSGILIGKSADGKPQLLAMDGFASAFLNRLLTSYQSKGSEGAKNSLKNMKIIIDGCSGYNLSKHIVDRMKTLYNDGYATAVGLPFEDIALPTIVTMAGDSSPVVLSETSGSRALTSDSYLEKIKKAGGLTGQILFDLQSESYLSGGDMGFFISDHGVLKEISSNQKTIKPTSPEPTFTADNDIRNA